MRDTKIYRFPVNGERRYKNRLGRHAVPCLVSGRYLQFPETSEVVEGASYMFVDVMAMAVIGEGKPRKLCRICISKEDLIAVLEQVDKKIE